MVLELCFSYKNATTKTLLVRNIGNKEARFQLSLEEPFSVTPDSGRLAIGESLQVHVDFNPINTGDHTTNMILHYDTGNYYKILYTWHSYEDLPVIF